MVFYLVCHFYHILITGKVQGLMILNTMWWKFITQKKILLLGKKHQEASRKNQLYEVEYKKSQYKVQLQIWRPFILCIKVTLVFFIVASSQYLIYISGIFWIIGSKFYSPFVASQCVLLQNLKWKLSYIFLR